MVVELFLLIVLIQPSLSAAHETNNGNISINLEIFVRLFPGLYDNIQQYKDDINRGLPPEQRHVRYTTQLKREIVPLFPGRRHFYIEQYVNGNRSEIVRQKLYSVGLGRRGGIYMKIFSFRDPEKFRYAQSYSRLFRELGRDDLVSLDGCDVVWIRKAIWPPRFESRVEKNCYINYEGVKVRVEDTNIVTLDFLTVGEKWFAPNGTEIFGTLSPYVLLRQSPLERNPVEWSES